MKTITTHGSFEDAISASSVHVREIAAQLRKMIIEIYPEVVEVPWPKQKIIGYGVGPKKMSEHFCYIGAHLDYVNLGFYYGADLSDPQRLLEGTGKKFRHIKVRRLEEVQQHTLRQMIEISLEERRMALNKNT
jgi:hypothetical protein